MTIATTTEQLAAQQSVHAWAKSSDPIALIRSFGPRETPAAPRGLAELGLLGVAVPEVAGGAGGTVADLAAMLEAAAFDLAPGPLLSTVVAAVVLGDHALTAELAAGTRSAAVAVNAQVTRVGAAISGTALAYGYRASEAIVVPVPDGVLIVRGGRAEVLESLDRSVGLARMTWQDEPVEFVHTAVDARLTFVALAAAECAGIADWALRTAVAYAKTREQFGVKIGSFQAIKHICATMLCRVEAASAVAWDAAAAVESARAGDLVAPAGSAAAGSGPGMEVASAVAASVALDAAVDNVKDCIQVLGGIGFTYEHDAHLYLRRANALRQVLGGSDGWRVRLAGLTRTGARREPALDLPVADADRAAVRAEIAGLAGLAGTDLRVALADSGLLAPHWPPPHGRGADAAMQLLIDAELAAAGIVRPDIVIAGWALPTIIEHGTPEQIERHVLPGLRGEVTWCQLFSEPEAGSDLASLRTLAARVEGGWSLTGQKVWTSLAQHADWGICLARTNKDVPKHRGITYFLVDMRSPGISIRPLAEITGEERFNEVFLEDVFVPDDCVVGDVDGGWRLANTTLANERVAIGSGSPLGPELESLVAAIPADDQVANARLGGLIANAMAGSLLQARAVLRQLAGRGPGPESSVRKLLGVTQRQDVAEFAMVTAGVKGALEGKASFEFMLTRCLSIAGGTTQVLLNVVAERLLGLPRG